MADEKHYGIWLEVAEVRFESRGVGCSVLLKADREQPKPDWWRVEPDAVKGDDFETYKAILNEMDKKRLVLARLSSSASQKAAGQTTADKADLWLSCDAFRFQSPELGSR